MVKIITVGNLKGGTGKSSVLFNLCGILSSQQRKVLVIDLDPQGDVSANLGKNRHHNDFSVANLFKNVKRAEELVETTNIRSVSLIKGSMHMTAIEYGLTAEKDREFILKRYIQSNSLFFEKFDTVLIDTNPTFSITNTNAYMASDYIYIVSDTSKNSLDKAEELAHMWDGLCRRYGMDNNIGAFIINRYDKRTKLHRQFVDAIDDHPVFGYFFTKPVIPYAVAYLEAEVEQRPIFKGKHYEIYKDLAKNLMKRGVL